jgi:phage terminase small subunit
MKGERLNERERAFVREYLVDLNATQAAIRAGYSPRSAKTTGNRMLTKADIQEAIAAANKQRVERVELKADDVIRELMLIAFGDLGRAFGEAGRLLALGEMDADVRRTIASIEVDELGGEAAGVGFTRKVKTWDKLRALEMLGRHLQLFIDKTEVSGEVTVSDAADVRSTILARLAALRDARAGSGGAGGPQS